MKTLKVGLTGSHGTGKTYIVDEVEKRAIQVGGIVVGKIVSPTRYVKSLGFQNNQNLDFQNEFMCIALRIERQRRLLLDPPKNWNYLILADRVGLDELSYTREAIERQRKQLEGVTGSARFPLEQLEKLYSLTESMIYTEANNYWDRVYYKSPHPDHLPVVDEARPGELDYQLEIDSWMRYHWNHLPDDIAEELDKDRDEAVEEVWSYVKQELGV